MRDDTLTGARVPLVDVYCVRQRSGALEALVLRRAIGRSPGSWEAVHGHIENDETPPEAAWREVIEETGLTPLRLYNLSKVESFYLHRLGAVALVPVFAAFLPPEPVTLSHEHDTSEWLPIGPARERLSWPRSRRALDDLVELLGSGDAGVLEDVLRVR
jgi:dATP pyrophosphohydrolase